MSLSKMALAAVLVAFAHPASAQSASAEELESQIDTLAAGPAGQAASEEIARARDFLQLARSAREAGHDRVAEGLLSLIPLQLRLVREILRALEAERRADEVEGEVTAARERSRAEREALEAALARMLALTVLREGD